MQFGHTQRVEGRLKWRRQQLADRLRRCLEVHGQLADTQKVGARVQRLDGGDLIRRFHQIHALPPGLLDISTTDAPNGRELRHITPAGRGFRLTLPCPNLRFRAINPQKAYV